MTKWFQSYDIFTQEEKKTYGHTKTRIQIFIVDLFTIS